MGLFEVFSGALTGFYALIPNYGAAIILLTLAVRVLLLPLSIKQTKSMREMQVIQPEVKKIQAKHKGDRQKMNEEMMALYKEHGVNPLGGCAPLLLQFPILIALFYVVQKPLAYMGYEAPQVAKGVFVAPADFCIRIATATVEACTTAIDAVTGQVSGIIETLQHSRLAEDLIEKGADVYSFLGLQLNCSASGILRPPTEDVLAQASDASRALTESCGAGLAASLPYLVLVLLMGFTTWYQQKQMQARQDPNNPQMAQMQMFAKIMPVMLMFFAFSFPTGVVLYWLTTNVWTIAQQRIMLKAAPIIPPVAGTKGKSQSVSKGSKTESKTEPKTGSKAEPPTDTTAPDAASDAKPSGAGTANRSKKKKKR